jgi:DNA-binding XRE family transcriptional regulator
MADKTPIRAELKRAVENYLIDNGVGGIPLLQEYLAAELKIPPTSLSAIIRGRVRPGPERMSKIAKVLKRDAQDIFPGEYP